MREFMQWYGHYIVEPMPWILIGLGFFVAIQAFSSIISGRWK